MAMRLASCVCGTSILLVGCAHTTHKATPHTTRQLFGWQGLTDNVVTGVNNEYVQLVDSSALDLWPGSLAVARIAAAGNDPKSAAGVSFLRQPGSQQQEPSDQSHRPVSFETVGAHSPAVLAMTPPNELVDWMELFDDIWAITEVFPLTYPRYPDREIRPGELIEQAAQAGAHLCLIYRENVQPLRSAEFRGVLYEIPTGKLLAGIHASATAPPSKPQKFRWPGRHATEKPTADPRIVARNRFKGLVRSCVLDWVSDYENNHQPPFSPGQTVAGQALPNSPVTLSAERRP